MIKPIKLIAFNNEKKNPPPSPISTIARKYEKNRIKITATIWDEIIRMGKTTWLVDTEQKLNQNLLFFKFLSLVMAICTYFQIKCSAFEMVKTKLLKKIIHHHMIQKFP